MPLLDLHTAEPSLAATLGKGAQGQHGQQGTRACHRAVPMERTGWHHCTGHASILMPSYWSHSHRSMQGGGMQGSTSIPRWHFVGYFVTPFSSCPKPISDPSVYTITPSSSMVTCPWQVSTEPRTLCEELGLSPGSPRLLQSGVGSIPCITQESGDPGP